MPRYAIPVSLCAAIILAGCHVSTSPETIAELQPGRAGTIITTPYDGTYSLYKLHEDAHNDLEQAGPPLVKVHLNKGRNLGFRSNASGKVEAVAGVQSMVLTDGTYQWIVEGDSGQLDWGKSSVIGAIVAGAMIAFVVFAVATF